MSHLYEEEEEEEENTDPQWLHPEAALRTSVGVTFPGRLLGNIALRCSLTAFDFAGRSAVVRECISRVCRAAGRPLGHARPVQLHFAARPPASMAAALANSPVRLADLEVTLSVTATYLTSISLADSQVVLQHHLWMVSFMLALEEDGGGGGGGGSILDQRKSGDARMKKESTSGSRYVAYVANDGQERLCVVFDCGQRAAEVAKTIGQAFALCSRTTTSTAQQSTNSSDKPLLKPTNHPPLPPLPKQSSPSSSSSTLPHIYYNAESVHRRRQSSVEREVQPLEKKAEVEEEEEEDKDLSSHTDTFICHDTNSSSSSSSSSEEEHFFETLSAAYKASTPNSSSTNRPPPPPQPNRNQKLDINIIPCPADLVDHVLESAPYFHGALSREGAERLLFASAAEDGAFLVRLRANNANAAIISPRQRYIISTRQIGGEGGEKSSEIHHALLQQADGSVTNDGVYYASVSRMLATALLRGRPLVTTEGRPLRLLAPVQAPLYAAIFPPSTTPSAN